MICKATLSNVQIRGILVSYGEERLSFMDSVRTEIFLDREMCEFYLCSLLSLAEGGTSVNGLDEKSREIAQNVFYRQEATILIKRYRFLRVQDENLRQFFNREGAK